MQLIKSVQKMKEIRQQLSGKVGFVPTMGALHSGHLSLVKSAQECENIVVSIFVNPTQFGENEDLDSYPRDLDADLQKLKKYKVDYVFFPTSEMMYQKGYRTWVNVEGITNILCGDSRPGHFRGVTTVVNKLVNIIKPDRMYMGLKDFQQITVLETMLRDLNMDTQIVRCPIIRESDGLAMSSRNAYLNSEERKNAVILNQAMRIIQDSAKIGDEAQNHISKMKKMIEDKGGNVDYIEIVSTKDLSKTEKINKDSHIVLAVFMGKTRLIDNLKIF